LGVEAGVEDPAENADAAGDGADEVKDEGERRSWIVSL
jgi:hypothetical protein